MSHVSIGWRDIREGGLRIDEVEDALGLDVSPSGDEDWAICPLPSHTGDRSDAHFSINRETYEWHCFTCGGGGKLPLLVQYCLGLDRKQALNWLAEFSDVNPDAPIENWVKRFRSMGAEQKKTQFERPPTLPWIPERMLEPYWEEFATNTAVQEWVHDKWGIEPDVMFDFSLGYGEYNHKGRFTGPAIIIPHYFDGKLVGWQARWTEPPWSAGEVMEKFPKYVNTDDFPKRYTLYNWDRVKGSTEPLVVVESFATTLKLYQCGYQSVATFGAGASDEQEEILSRYRGPIYIAADNDPTGRSSQRALVSDLRLRQRVWIVPPPEGEKADMGDLTAPEIDALMAQAKPHFLAQNK